MPDNRTRLIEVATQLFATHGYDAVGVQQIVEAAGVTKPTLYHYFESKRGLLDAVVEDKASELLHQLKKVTVYQQDITASITALFTFYFGYARQHPTFYRMVLSMWFAPTSSEYYLTIADLQQRQFLLIEYMFQQAAEQHGNMKGRHKQYAVSLKGTIDTYIGLALQGYINLETPDLIYRVVHQFMHGIFS